MDTAGDFDHSSRTDRIRQEIDSTRDHLDGTIDEIQYRLTPEQILQRTLASCQRAAWNGAGKAVSVAKEHPLPAAMIGAGVLWLARQIIASSANASETSQSGGRAQTCPSVAPHRSAASRVRETIANTAESVTDGVKHAAENVAEGVKHAAENVAEGVKHAGSSAVNAVSAAGAGATDAARSAGSYVADAASAVGTGVQRSARKTADWTDSFVHEYPLGAAAACFALGLAGGLALPATRKEDELLGEQRDRLMREARKAGGQLLQKGEAVVQKAGGAVTQAVQRQVGEAVDRSGEDGSERNRHGTGRDEDKASTVAGSGQYMPAPRG